MYFFTRTQLTCFILMLLLIPATAVHAGQHLPPCADREHFRDKLWVNGDLYCLETVIKTDQLGELAYTALAVAPDGTLYSTSPVQGQVLALTDSDGDQLPDRAEIIAQNLTLPNGLAYYQGALYISASKRLYRLEQGQLETIVDDLPVGPGQWAGSLIIGPDERLYVSIGACDLCESLDPRQGAILSYTLNGTDPKVIASGIRQHADLVFFDDTLWITDSARQELADVPDLDELNRVTLGAHFGWPYCVGLTNEPDQELASAFDCTRATGPALTFPTGSTPLGLAAYTNNVLPELSNTLLVVLNGSRHRVDLQGYALAVIHFDKAGNPVDYEVLMPFEVDSSDKVGFTTAEMNYRISGFWPHRPIDVAVSAEGWVYISVGGGEILALRPH